MICDNCKTDFQPRKAGSPQRFCSGGKCRREFDSRARKTGASVLRAKGAPKARRPRIDLLARMEREADAAGVPGMYAHPQANSAQNLRLELGRAALRLGLL